MAGRQTKAEEAWSWLDDTFCVTSVFMESPAGRLLTDLCLNLLNSVRVYCVAYQVSAFALDLGRDELFTAILSAPFLAEC